jgi:hypothetical protein
MWLPAVQSIESFHDVIAKCGHATDVLKADQQTRAACLGQWSLANMFDIGDQAHQTPFACELCFNLLLFARPLSTPPLTRPLREDTPLKSAFLGITASSTALTAPTLCEGTKRNAAQAELDSPGRPRDQLVTNLESQIRQRQFGNELDMSARWSRRE